MSGIVGFINHKDPAQGPTILNHMLERIRHRGPDSQGTVLSPDHGLGLGACVHEVSPVFDGNQMPVENAEGTLVLTFSGSIQNRAAVKEELNFFGHPIADDSDPGLILAAYQAWGPGMVEKLDGFFAFAVWDKDTDELFMARDPFGIEPCYYSRHTTDGSFIFASEIKAFLAYPAWKKELNPLALRPFLSLQYPAMEETFFQGVYKLPPGTYLRYKDGQVETKRYWHMTFEGTQASLQEGIEAIQTAVAGAVERSKAGLENYGSFLSGGIDSSYIAALALPEKSFTVGFVGYEGQFNESVYGQELADILGIDHHVRLLTGQECFQALPRIQYHLDEPQANLSTIPLYFLSEMAADHVDVVLSGEGADELFGGYDSYRDTDLMARYKTLPFAMRRGIAKVACILPRHHVTTALVRAGQRLENTFVGEAKVFSDHDALAILKKPYQAGPRATDLTAPIYETLAGEGELTKKQIIDMELFMPEDVLLKADKMTAAHGLQVRAPFMDRKVVAVAASLPEAFRVQGLTTKYALRKAALENLPEAWAKRPKAGFMVPMKDWLRQEERAQEVRTLFSRPYVAEFFDQAKILAYVDDHVAGRGDHQRKIYTIMAFLIWYEEYFLKR